ncbi:MAG: ABC transporter ATP-binding protein [Bacilli bacterium]|nr:ABC transporter ATP-binding protein [Bacilli bacterium]
MLKPIKYGFFVLIVITFFTVLMAGFDVVYNLIVRNIIDESLAGDASSFQHYLGYVIAIMISYAVVILLYAYVKSIFFKKVMSKLKANYIKRVFKKNINEFQRDNNSMYLSALTNDYEQVEQNYLDPILEIIFSVVNFAAGVFLFAVVKPYILFIALGLMVINMIVATLSSKPLNKHNKERSELMGGYTSYIKEFLSAFHIIKTNNLDQKIREDYTKKSEVIQQKGYVIDRLKTIIFAIEHTNFSFTFIGLILVIGYLSIKGAITFGSVVLIIQSAEKIVWPVRNFAESLPKVLSIRSIFKRIDQTLANKNDYPETVDFTGFQKGIYLQDVSFGYEDNAVIEHASVHFEKGKKYLIVGPSGGGKSTVLKLLRKYHVPKEGAILLDDVNLMDMTKRSYFAHIANIEQNVFLFEDTIRNNLTLYKDYTEAEINDALVRSGLDEFVNSLPEGLDTIIYDNGKNISGGERSRLAIARGLINKSDIIFLDEAFANLDAERAKAIEEKILQLKDITIINVSHVIFKEHRNLYDDVFVVANKTISTLA